MTANQIRAAELFEKKRSNMRNEQISQGGLDETIRHNKAFEAETRRHNIQQDSIGWGNLGEQKRHAQAQESVNYLDYLERKRHNKTAEEISRLHNLSSDSNNWFRSLNDFSKKATGSYAGGRFSSNSAFVPGYPSTSLALR